MKATHQDKDASSRSVALNRFLIANARGIDEAHHLAEAVLTDRRTRYVAKRIAILMEEAQRIIEEFGDAKILEANEPSSRLIFEKSTS